MTFTDASVVVCEDIRVEGNGKHMLIGVYATDMIVAQFPSVVQLAFWIRAFPPPPPGEHTFKAIVKIPGGGEGTIDGSALVAKNVPGDVPVVLTLPAVPLQLHEPGRLEILLAFDGGEPELVGGLPIRPAGMETKF